MTKNKKDRALKVVVIALAITVAALVLLLILEASGVFYRTPDPEYPVVTPPETGSEVFSDGSYQYVLTKDGGAMLTACGISDRNIKTIAIPESVGGHKVVAIGDGAFQLFTWVTRIDIPEGITYVGKNAFYGCCYLDVIYLPKTLSGVADGAFSDCDHLSGIYFAGSETEWKNIAVGRGNNALGRAETFWGN